MPYLLDVNYMNSLVTEKKSCQHSDTFTFETGKHSVCKFEDPVKDEGMHLFPLYSE